MYNSYCIIIIFLLVFFLLFIVCFLMFMFLKSIKTVELYTYVVFNVKILYIDSLYIVLESEILVRFSYFTLLTVTC